MITETPHILNPRDIFANGDDDFLVGIAMIGPSTDTASFYPRMVRGFVETMLLRAGVHATRTGAVFGPGWVVVLAHVPVTERKFALSELERIAGDVQISKASAWQIAFYDQAEGAWRVIRGNVSAPFDRFLSEDAINAAQARMVLEMREIAEYLRINSPNKPEGQ
jgi:hypothetical protein